MILNFAIGAKTFMITGGKKAGPFDEGKLKPEV